MLIAKKQSDLSRWHSHNHFNITSYLQESPSSEALRARQYERLQDWSPSEEMDRPFSKANSDSPPFGRLNKRFGKQRFFFFFGNETVLFFNL